MIHTRRSLTSGLINQLSSTVGILGECLRSHCILRLVPPSVHCHNQARILLFAAPHRRALLINPTLILFIVRFLGKKKFLKKKGKRGGMRV